MKTVALVLLAALCAGCASTREANPRLPEPAKATLADSLDVLLAEIAPVRKATADSVTLKQARVAMIGQSGWYGPGAAVEVLGVGVLISGGLGAAAMGMPASRARNAKSMMQAAWITLAASGLLSALWPRSAGD